MWRAAVVWIFCLGAVFGAGAEERRLALVIANEDYPAAIGRLTNTHEDAGVVEAALRSAGFSVTKVLDANADEMDAALTQFEIAINQEAADGDDVVAFFYGSMHGAAADVNGRTRNYLLPAREEIASTGQLIRKGVRMDQMIAGFSATDAKAVLVVSDACRNNLGTSFSKSTTKGFVPERTGPGVLVAYATAPGSTTPDDGLFASVLATSLGRSGRKASFAMLEAVETVAQQRSFDGQPFLTSGGLPDWLCFKGCNTPPQGTAQPQARDLEQDDWDRFNATGSKAAYETYLTLHPNGRYAPMAKSALREISLKDRHIMGAKVGVTGDNETARLLAALVRLDSGAFDFNSRTVFENLRTTYSLEAFSSAAVQGDGLANLLLGRAYKDGIGVDADPARGRAFYQEACDRGTVAGCLNFGTALQRGIGGAQDLVQARTQFEFVCAAGDLRGCYNLGVLVRDAAAGQADYEEAVRLFRDTCDGGFAHGCNGLGAMYERGWGVNESSADASSYYALACDGGLRDACSKVE